MNIEALVIEGHLNGPYPSSSSRRNDTSAVLWLSLGPPSMSCTKPMMREDEEVLSTCSHGPENVAVVDCPMRR